MQTLFKDNQKDSSASVLPLITLAIPTYKRPQLLKRAISSAISQDYPNLEILISDNATPENASDPVVAEFMAKDSRITYFNQEKNIYGDNFFFLLEKAKGDFFMWLADDDQITPNFVSSLSKILLKDPSISCAFSAYTHISPSNTVSKRKFEYASPSYYLRILKFIFNPDDGFFYGLHRTGLLRSIPYRRWWWPNHDTPLNSAFAYLFDIVLSGKICLTNDETVLWINDESAPKDYNNGGGGWFSIFQFIVRRINLYWEYVRRSFSRGRPGLAAFIAFLTPAALFKDYFLFGFKILVNRIKKSFRI